MAGTFELYQRLLGLRRRNPWLVDGVVSSREVTNETIVVVVEGHEQVLEIVLNVSDADVPLPRGEIVMESGDCRERVCGQGWAIGLSAR